MGEVVILEAPASETAMKRESSCDHIRSRHVWRGIVLWVQVMPSGEVAQSEVPIATKREREGDHAIA